MPARLMVVIFGICLLLLGVLWFFSPLRNSIPGIPTTTRLPEKNFASNENVSIALQGVQVKKTETKLTRFDGKVAGATINSLQKDNNAVFTIEKPIAFQPGKYTFTITTSDKKTYVQDFTWGVLAINTNKSIYLPQETAKLSLAVLDEEGMMVCDANVELRIRNHELGIDETLSTENKRITVNPECKVKNYTERPDYEATYRVGGVGNYDIELTATTKTGTYTITDGFSVKDSVPFSVERVSATRIYPIHKYPVHLTITANQDFSGEIIDSVPQSFEISSASASQIRLIRSGGEDYDHRDIVWKVSLHKGEVKQLLYWYDAPDTSPYFFLIGPLKFVASGRDVFTEQRSWQLAVDAVPTAVEQQVNLMDQTYSTTLQTSAPTDNSLGIVNYASANYSNNTSYLETDMKKVNGDKLNISMDYHGTRTPYTTTYCVSSTDCKIAYIDQTNHSIRFRDCDDTACATGGNVTIEGKNCVLAGCTTSLDVSGSGALGQVAMSCPATDDCKVVYTAFATSYLYFVDCDNATCSSGSTRMITGGAGCTLTGCNTDSVNYSTLAIDCSQGATDCKIAYRDAFGGGLRFIDCDNATCTSGTIQKVDGTTGCLLSGCNSGDSVGLNGIVLDCSQGASDCKIGYDNSTKTALYFADCDSATCNSGTVTLVDGYTSCPLTNCNAADSIPNSYGISMDCPSASDCKFFYYNSTKNAVYFADCDSATCNSGTVTLVDGIAGCSLTGCTTNNYKELPSIDCVGGGSDCKLAYFDLNTGAIYFGDCDNATCSSGTRKVIDGGTGCTLTGCSTSSFISGNTSFFCVSATDCKITYENHTSQKLYFGDCDDSLCGTGTTTYIDGKGWGKGDSGKFSDVYCINSTDCKMVWYEVGDTALHFRDCDNASCSSGTTVFLDGISGCLTSGCQSGDDTGKSVSIYCLSSTDCKIAYINETKTALYFIDCDSATCNKSTTTLLDGFTGCALTSCVTSGSVDDPNYGRQVQLYCIATDDCKIAYSMNNDLYFADCSNATCSSGTVKLLDGAASCVLTGCNTGDTLLYVWGELSLKCPATDDCKVAYYNYTKSAIYFADCNAADCSSGTTTLLDGFTSCVLSGCSSGDDTGEALGMDCSTGSADCKIAYWDNTTTNDGLNFIDCDSSDCTTGTLQNIYGKPGCPLTNCVTTTTNTPSYGVSVDCVGNTADCKIAFFVFDQTGIDFADCDSATCNSGTVRIVDGYTSCVLSGCISADNSGYVSVLGMDCASSSDCKIAYYDYTANDAMLADCATATCSSGTVTVVEDKDDEYAWAQLYTIGGTIVPDGITMLKTDNTYTRVRTSNPLTLSDGDYTVRTFSSDDSDVTSAVKAARLIHDQSNGGGITATESQVEMGDTETTTAASYGRLTDPKIYLFNSAKFSGTVTVNFEATMKGSAGGVTASAALSSDSNCSSTVAGSDVTVTGTTWTRSRTASPITLTDNTEYWVCLKTSSGTASMANAKLIIDQTDPAGIQKMELVHQYLNSPQTDTDSTYTSQNYLNQLTKANIVGDVVNYYFETTMKTSAGTGYAQLYDSSDTSAVSGSEQSTTSTSYTRKRSSDLNAVLTTAKDYDTQLKNAATDTTSVSNAWMVIDISTILIQPRANGPIRVKGNTRIK